MAAGWRSPWQRGSPATTGTRLGRARDRRILIDGGDPHPYAVATGQSARARGTSDRVMSRRRDEPLAAGTPATTQPWIEHVAQRVAQHVEAEHRE